MNRFRRTFLLSAVALLVAGCGIFGGAAGTLDNTGQALSPLITTIADRHDGYVANDQNLSSELRSAFQLDSAFVLAAFKAETVEIAPIAVKLNGVLDRHDAYVTSDASLTAQKRDVFLLSSRNVRRTAAAALGN